jgi:hypothetical protein
MIIWHRVNTIEHLKSININDGVEIDVRSIKGVPYLSHFIDEDGVDFEEWLKHYNLKGTLVINVKEEGLEMIIIKLLKKYNITNYMFLDEPFWYLLNSSRKLNNKNFAIRVSKFESVETALKSRELSDWVWYDYFDNYINTDDIKKLIDAGFKVIMPAPELVNSNVSYIEELEKNNINIYAICKN